MNGELILKGYKFTEKLILNLQDKTVLTGEDSFTAFEVFNMLENYFNRKSFSEYYLDNGTILILNGNKLSGSEFVVFRMRPVVNLAEELKISKKSILGQVLHNVFDEGSDEIPKFMAAIEMNLLSRMNAITEEYRVSFACDEASIFTLAKILLPVVREKDGQDILQQEHDQYYCKAMLLDLVARLKTDKKKLLLIELPEYGLQQGEVTEFLKLLSVAPIDNIIIYTYNREVCKIIPQVFNYNVIRNSRLCGFDDYDMLEKELQNILLYDVSGKEIEQKVLDYIFHSPANCKKNEEFALIVEGFLSK